MPRSSESFNDLFAHIDRAVDVLEAMDECTVARNATEIIKRTLSRAKRLPQVVAARSALASLVDGRGSVLTHADLTANAIPTDLPAPAGRAEIDTDWLNVFPFNDNQQGLFWTEWAYELNGLGT